MTGCGFYALMLAVACTATAQAQRLPNAIWAPGGKRFVYIENRSLWLYDVPSASRRELAPLARMDRQAIPSKDAPDGPRNRPWEPTIQWSPTGKDLLISASGDLFLYHLQSARWDQITATPEFEHDARLSPDGAQVAFRRGHDLYAVEIATHTITRLTQDGSATVLNAETDWVYPRELGLASAYWWSPDSNHIAYLQFDVSRESVFPLVSLLDPKARVESQLFPQPGTPNAEVHLAVISLGGNRRWMDLGHPRDRLLSSVHWSPDGRNLAVERFNRTQNRLDLLLADVETGEARSLLHEQDPCWINWNSDFRFLGKGEQFLWGSERDGFHHLYLYSTEGQRFAQITRGNWEVAAVAGADEAARQVFYSSNESSPIERQLFRVDFDGKNKQQITAGKGTHIVSMSPALDYYLDSYSAVDQPPAIVIHRSGGEQAAVYAAALKPADPVLPAELRSFRSRDGETLYARLIRPARFIEGKKYPVVVMVYGGPRQQHVRDVWRVSPLEQQLAAAGFAIWQVDNRGSSGRGHQWETRIYHNLGAQELKDQLEGLDYLLSLGIADPARVGIHGWSYGGYLTLYALTNSGVFRAGAAAAPVTDWRNYDSIYTERYMGLPDANPEGYRNSSPITRASEMKASLLLLHNIEDDNVHFQHTMQMAAALEEAGKDFDMAVYPQRSHGVTGALRAQADRTIVKFFERTMK